MLVNWKKQKKTNIKVGSVVYLQWKQNGPPVKRVVVATGFHNHRGTYVAALFHVAPEDPGEDIILAPLVSLVPHTSVTMSFDNSLSTLVFLGRFLVMRLPTSPKLRQRGSRRLPFLFIPSCP